MTTCEKSVPKIRSTLWWTASFSTTSAPRFGSVPSSSATISIGRPPMPPFSLMSFTAAAVVRSYQRP